MNWLRLVCLLTYGSSAWAQQKPLGTAEIDVYVREINTNKNLIKLQIRKYSAQDAIFLVYHTDYPCSASVYYLDGKITKIREVVRIGSAFAINEYYLKNGELLFANAQEIYCSYFKHPSGNACHATNTNFHGTYYYMGKKCFSSQESNKSERRVDRPYPEKELLFLVKEEGFSAFFTWQANRYILIYSKALRHSQL